MARLSVRLPKTELDRIKRLAARRGVTLQNAVRQALEVWAFPLTHTNSVSLEALQGSLAGVDVEKLMHNERKAELAKDRRRSELITSDPDFERQKKLTEKIMRDDRRILKTLAR